VGAVPAILCQQGECGYELQKDRTEVVCLLGCNELLPDFFEGLSNPALEFGSREKLGEEHSGMKLGWGAGKAEQRVTIMHSVNESFFLFFL
jgi:hypothetical protein